MNFIARRYIEQFSRFRRVCKVGKACKKPAKSPRKGLGVRNDGSPEMEGFFQREGTTIRVPEIKLN